MPYVICPKCNAVLDVTPMTAAVHATIERQASEDLAAGLTAALTRIDRLRGELATARSEAASWESVSQRQAAELTALSARNLLLDTRVKRLEARALLRGLQVAAAATLAGIDPDQIDVDPRLLSQQMDRAHQQ